MDYSKEIENKKNHEKGKTDTHIPTQSQKNGNTPNILTQSQNYGNALNILQRLQKKGYKAFFAGGCVRDMLMGIESRDFDIVTNAPMETIPDLFQATGLKPVGKTFPVFIIHGVEVASCRTTNQSMPFPECDLKQRDLTINSMAIDPIQDALIDPFDGQRDLVRKIIRFTDDPEQRITEDPIRMVRACRFVSAFQGTLDRETLQIIQTHGASIMEPAIFSRIGREIMKAMAHKKPSIFFRALHQTGLLAMIFPSLERCAGLDGGPYHGETVMEHCLLTGDALMPRSHILRLAGYLHDAGKYDAAKIKDGKLTFAGHENMTHAVIHDLEQLKFSKRDIRHIDSLIKTHMRPLKAGTTPRAVRRILAFLKANQVTWQEFMRMRIADKSANLAKAPYTLNDIKIRVSKIHREIYNSPKNAFTLKDLAITGHDIMEILSMPQGKGVGKVMNHLFEMVLENPRLNSHGTLKEYLLKNWNNNEHSKSIRDSFGDHQINGDIG
ncbi:MAG: CCA tRNA nucleotidyltransferase [Desulfamplus sp.]|nr:CCA tRNA nucleotidyltransferase [Desulfamplus sp.]